MLLDAVEWDKLKQKLMKQCPDVKLDASPKVKIKLGRDNDQDPLKKREEFALTVRKSRKKDVLFMKRLMIFPPQTTQKAANDQSKTHIQLTFLAKPVELIEFMTSQSIPFETEDDKVGADGNSKTFLKGIEEKNWKSVARIV